MARLNQLKGLAAFCALSLIIAPVSALSDEDAAPAEEAPAASDQATATEEVKTADASAEDPNEIICKSVKSTKSRIGRVKDCRTRKQWNDTFNAFRSVNDIQNSYSTNTPSQ